MHKFPDDASEATPIQCLLEDCLERNEKNDKDGLSFDNDFAAKTLNGLCEAGDI